MDSEDKTRIAVLKSLIKDEPSRIANLANASALLGEYLDRINWVGFYLLDDNELVLGPFQGKPACVRIALGKGVCGTAALTKEIIRVPDVHEFPGHIACDAASRSEIVIPLFQADDFIGVLDIDSPFLDRFSEEDQQFLEAFAETLSLYL
ncbi:GAF domain-containing protein [Sporolactobacillus spathodeae]|uniref:GAF domain-containing protein n=1 Tax=Sporolactobacillus spathodeae TaxID=1465502 RepID=A0ABS2QC35_9BACL|nr:GAF domain-containing protein [Sporolactobacillus spathodeae]MBM7658880.1 GAF domain-containing protein [Sporolactobacillus spathodeae]